MPCSKIHFACLQHKSCARLSHYETSSAEYRSNYFGTVQGQEIPIYIWYENYPTHSGEGYEGRVSRVSPDSPFGAASLNLTNIRESDQGWYECKVVFLNRSPNQHKNGSWFHLDVHAPPRFSVTPEDIVYVNLGKSPAISILCHTEFPKLLFNVELS